MSRSGRIGLSYKSNIYCSENVITLMNNFIYEENYKVSNYIEIGDFKKSRC